ncbi:MAG: metallophosphoesterase [Syntrophaceae bacterium]|nr:metallophosphoesterase [Syntrophaceae bacterium]
MRSIFFGLSILLSLSFVSYGYFDAQSIRINKLEIYSSKLSPDFEKIRIVQLSDVHIGLIIRDKRLKSILEHVKDSKPDILVSTGDLLDGELDDVSFEAGQFAEIKPKYGKYAVTGNHEYYAGIEKSLEFTQKAGFEILRNESKKVAGINIIGIEDLTGRKRGLTEQSPGSFKLFPKEKINEFILLLKHQPIVQEDVNFDLQLSGHTHRGQIFPFMLFVRIFFPMNSGYHELSNNKFLYISNGAGTWGPPVRFLAPPEITVIDLIKK